MRLLPRAAKLKNPCQCNSTCLSGCRKIRLQEGLSLLARFASTSAGSGLTATQFLATTSALTGAWVAVLVFSTLSSSAPQIQLRIPLAMVVDAVLLAGFFLSSTLNTLRRSRGRRRSHDAPIVELPGIGWVPEQP